MSGPRTLNGKIVLQVYTLDNSYKTLLIEPTSTVHVCSSERSIDWCCGGYVRIRRSA